MPEKELFPKVNFENTFTNGGKNGPIFQVYPNLHTKSPMYGKIWLKMQKVPSMARFSFRGCTYHCHTLRVFCYAFKKQGLGLPMGKKTINHNQQSHSEAARGGQSKI